MFRTLLSRVVRNFVHYISASVPKCAAKCAVVTDSAPPHFTCGEWASNGQTTSAPRERGDVENRNTH